MSKRRSRRAWSTNRATTKTLPDPKPVILILLAILAVWCFILVSQAHAERTDGSAPFALVELYTSEGCSSCPPADRILQQLTREARDKDLRVFTLSFHVDYWNYLGWRDPFSQASFSDRQRRFAQITRSSTVYTPQMIVNGEHGFGGYRADQAEQFIQQALSEPTGVTVDVAVNDQGGDSIVITYSTSGARAGQVINFAVVERGLAVDVSRGENAGRRIEHENVVRVFETFEVKDKAEAVVLKLPAAMDRSNSSVIAYVQDPATFDVLGVDAVDL